MVQQQQRLNEPLYLQVNHPIYGWSVVEEVHPDQEEWALETARMYKRFNNINARVVPLPLPHERLTDGL